MTICRLSRRAEADWREIGRFTQARWGVGQRRKYLEAMEAKLRLLASSPQIGTPRDDLLPGYRSMRIGRHVVYYLGGANGIDVVRILHERMDAASQLADEEPHLGE